MSLLTKTYKRFLFGIGLSVLLLSCVKNDYSKISTRIVWNPNLSLPLGTSYFDATNLQPFLVLDAIDETDTFFVADTLAFNFSELFINTEQINYVMFRTYIENGFPATIRAQTYFLDGAKQVVDSMYADGPIFVNAAKIGDDGALLEATIFTQDELRIDDGVNVLEHVRYVWIRLWMYDFMLTGENVDDYYIIQELGFQTDIEKENKE